MELLAHDLLYADDCALAAHSLEDAQAITDCFAQAAAHFGLTVSIKKTEVIKQARPCGLASSGNITINSAPLKAVDSFCYLGNMLFDATLDIKIKYWLSRASSAFRRLQQRDSTTQHVTTSAASATRPSPRAQQARYTTL